MMSSDEGTTDHFAIIRPIRFAVYFGQPMWNTSQHIGPNTHPSLSMPPSPSSSRPSHHPPTPHTQHKTHHTPHTSQVRGWVPGDEGTNDYFATIRPIGFAVYFAQSMCNTSQHIGPNAHPPLSMPPPPVSPPSPSPFRPSHRPAHTTHTTRDTPHTTHTPQVL